MAKLENNAALITGSARGVGKPSRSVTHRWVRALVVNNFSPTTRPHGAVFSPRPMPNVMGSGSSIVFKRRLLPRAYSPRRIF